MLERLADLCYRRRWRVVALWLLALFGTIAVSRTYGGDFNIDFSLPGSESEAALDLLEARFPERAGDTLDLVYEAEAGVDDPAVQAAIDDLVGELRAVPVVVAVDPARVGADGTIAIVPLQLTRPTFDLERSQLEPLVDIVEATDIPGVQVELGTDGFGPPEDVGSELIGLLAAALILLLAFGSVLAMGLPILMAVFGLGIASGLVLLLARVITVPDFTTQLAAMIGLGVGIDYSLFIITRYRDGLREGHAPRTAIVGAVSTAGRAVLFAGCVVIIALMGLVLMGLEFLVGVAFGTSFGVLVTMLAAITLLPALLGFAGHAIDRLRVPFAAKEATSHRHGFWFRWSRIVQRRPWPAAIGSFVVLLALAAPLFDLRLGFPDASNNPTSDMSRRAYDLRTEAFGPGANGPYLLVVEDATEARLATLAEAVSAVEGVAFVAPPQVSPDGSTAIVIAVPTTGPQEQETQDTLHRLRDDAIPAAVAGTDVAVHVGGTTAALVDQSEYLARRLPWFIGAVVLVSFWLLMGVFRSVLVAVKAAIMNLLSIGAAYGVVALAASGGWLGERFGIEEPTPVPGFIPMMMFAILFGLSMDYEVFLLSRIREEYVRTRDNALAVADGLAMTARVITAAAAIMCAVFLAFVMNDIVFVKLVGLGMATAIFVDATIVRMVLVPATMELLGDRNWWYPRFLDRITPHLNVEGNYDEVVRRFEAEEGDEPEREPALV